MRLQVVLQLELEPGHPAPQVQQVLLALLRTGLRLEQLEQLELLELLELELERPLSQGLRVFLRVVSALGFAPMERQEQEH